MSPGAGKTDTYLGFGDEQMMLDRLSTSVIGQRQSCFWSRGRANRAKTSRTLLLSLTLSDPTMVMQMVRLTSTPSVVQLLAPMIRSLHQYPGGVIGRASSQTRLQDADMRHFL